MVYPATIFFPQHYSDYPARLKKLHVQKYKAGHNILEESTTYLAGMPAASLWGRKGSSLVLSWEDQAFDMGTWVKF